MVQPLVEHFLVGPGSTIASLKDLAGRTVAIGRPGARNAITGPRLVAGAHLASPAHELETDFDTAIAKLLEGTVDAVLLPAPVPFPLVTHAVSRGARLIEIRGPLADSLRESVRFVRPYSIPPDTYPGVHSRIVTLGIDTVLVARRDLPNAVAQHVVAALFDCLPRLSAADPSFQTVDVTRAAAAQFRCTALRCSTRKRTSRSRRGQARDVIVGLACRCCPGRCARAGYRPSACEPARAQRHCSPIGKANSRCILTTAITRDMRGAQTNVLDSG